MKDEADKHWWTPARLDTLRQLWAEGHASAEIARRMGSTKNAVVGKAHRLKLPGRPSPINRSGADHPGYKHGQQSKAALAERAERKARAGAALVAQAERVARPARVAAAPPRAVVPIRRFLPPVRSHASPHRVCQWIEGEPAGPDTVFCGTATQAGSSYCPAHHARCWHLPIRREAA